VFAGEFDEAHGVVEVGAEFEDDLGAFDAVGDVFDADVGFLFDGGEEALLEGGGPAETVHEGGGHAVGGLDASGAVAVEPEFLVAFDAGGEGEDEKKEDAAHRLSVVGYWLGEGKRGRGEAAER